MVGTLPTMVYNLSVIGVVETEAFQRWMERLKDAVARARILARLKRASLGNLGDWKAVGGGVAEMRVDHGPATGSISPAAETVSSSSWPAARRRRKPRTSPRPSRPRSNWSDHGKAETEKVRRRELPQEREGHRALPRGLPQGRRRRSGL